LPALIGKSLGGASESVEEEEHNVARVGPLREFLVQEGQMEKSISAMLICDPRFRLDARDG